MGSRIPEKLTVPWIRKAYLSGEVTPEDIIRTIIDRADHSAEMNIWITPPRMERIRPYLERLAHMNPDTCELWGVPFAIKDNIDLAGVPTTAGCPDYQYVPKEHAAVVAKLLEAGAIPVGKTNLDQFATGLVGTRSPYGETHNALNSDLISGGSSSGSAVAVAMGQAVFALGTDTAGSGRVPAALNGIVGYKPRVGAWSTVGVVPACASLDCVTVFTHELLEARIVDRIVRGYDDLDPWSIPTIPDDCISPGSVCLPSEPPSFFGPYQASYELAWQETVRRIESSGLNVRYVDTNLFMQAASLLYDGPFVEERWAGLGAFIESNPGRLHPVTESVLRSGSAANYNGASVFRAMHTLQSLKREARKLLGDSVLILPTTGGTWSRDEIRQSPIARNSDLGQYTNHCNLLDMSAVAVPAVEAEAGLPFGISLFALAEYEGIELATADFLRQSLISPAPAGREEMVQVAVCGLHMRGYPLERQMHEHDATFVREDRTAAQYQLLKLATEPAKPGLIRVEHGGTSLELEVWEMPSKLFGQFVSLVPAPLAIGKVELQDGSLVTGFICEAYVRADEANEDITALGGWRALPILS